MLLLLFPTKIIPPPCTQGLSRGFAVYDASAVLECKDTKKFVIKQVFVFKKLPPHSTNMPEMPIDRRFASVDGARGRSTLLPHRLHALVWQ